ncbi:MAG TPA: MFS transporter [Acidimicrobiales bacterium]
MATRREAQVIKVAAVVQGIALVTFPAASGIFTDPNEYGLSSTAYGTMFVPQAVTAVASALLGATWARRVGTRRVYLVGLMANLAAMALLVASVPLQSHQSAAYVLLLLATASLGVGFGFTVPALNTFTAAFNPSRVDSSILVLNALLGLGTALAPVFVAVFVGLGFWWGLPVLAGCLVVGLLVVSSRLPLETGEPSRVTVADRPVGGGLPVRFWIYAGFALLYGICETMNGNWASIDMKQLGASTTEASLALTTFWASVTLGRVLFAAIQQRFATRHTYHLLPFVLAVAFVGISLLPTGKPALGILAFGLAGIGCSALLPLTISFGQEELVAMSASVAGGLIAFYQVGYGLAAFGAGPLQAAGVDLPDLFGIAAALAVVMGGLAYVIARVRPAPTTLHPRPATGPLLAPALGK